MVTTLSAATAPAADGLRSAWVDCAKGLCIIMVVAMHSTLGVEQAMGVESWLHGAIDFAKPFRMPDFFLIAGLFLSRVIDRDWRTYFDRKVLHFAYFYLIWVAIQAAVKQGYPAYATGDWAGFAQTLASALYEPPGTLWFIYLLPIFFTVAKLLRRMDPFITLGLAAVLQVLPIDSGFFIVDEFCQRLFFFLAGYHAAGRVFHFARGVDGNPGLAIAGLAVWAVVNATGVTLGIAHLPVFSLFFGLAGAFAVIALAVLLSRVPWGEPIRYCGEHSLVIYLAFFLPMAATRIVLIKAGLIEDPGLISLIVMTAALIGPLLLHRLVKGTPLKFLFERPAWPRLVAARRGEAAAA